MEARATLEIRPYFTPQGEDCAGSDPQSRLLKKRWLYCKYTPKSACEYLEKLLDVSYG